jgi:hypothetical protein
MCNRVGTSITRSVARARVRVVPLAWPLIAPCEQHTRPHRRGAPATRSLTRTQVWRCGRMARPASKRRALEGDDLTIWLPLRLRRLDGHTLVESSRLAAHRDRARRQLSRRTRFGNRRDYGSRRR